MKGSLARGRTFWFGQVDSRPLALFRIGFSLVLLKDAVYHLWLARMFYSDAGTLPRTVLWALSAPRFRVALLDAVGSAWGAGFVFTLWIGVLLLLLVGYRTRLMMLLNFLLIVSIQERNPYVLNAADVLMRSLSFWMLFLPLGKVYAIDALRRRYRTATITQRIEDLRAPETPPSVYALPLRIIQLQVALVYVFTVILKLEGAAWRDGTAVFSAMQLTDFLLPPGLWLVSYAPGWFFTTLTHGTMFIEVMFFILVFAPFGQPYLKGLGLLLGALLHTGIALTMTIPNFSVLMLTSYLLFIEGAWLSRKRDTVRRLHVRPPADGSSAWVLLALTRSSQVQVVETVPDEYQTPTRDTWQHAMTRGNALSPWQLVLHLDVTSRLWRRVCACWVCNQPPIHGLRRAETSHSPRVGLQLLGRAVVSVLLIGLMGAVVAWNLQTASLLANLPSTARTALLVTGLHQRWGMFAPHPPTSNGWVRVVGTFEDGSQVNLNTQQRDLDQPVQWLWGPSLRIRKFHETLRAEKNEPLREAYGRYFCRKYNILAALPVGRRLATLEIQRVWRPSVAYGEPTQAYNESLLWRHWCFEQYR